MNFFERQTQVRKVSARLVFLFIAAVVGIIVVVDAAAFFLLGLYEQGAGNAINVLFWITLLMLLVIVGTSLFRMLSLRNGGGGKVAQSLGGVYVPEDTTDPQLRRLRNVVEEIAIASGTPVPELYVLPNEQGINAFAAGWSTADAAVAVTRGTLERLNRDELQGVIAHEFSHVVNGDMRLNIRLMGVLFGILALAVVGRIALYSGRGRNGAPIMVIGLFAIVAGYIGLFCGRLIKAAVSRQREYLADASAVQFTRQADGIAGALKKIGGLDAGSRLRSGKTDDVSHMLFGEGRRFSSLFATHPPLPKRIQQLDPTFDPNELHELNQRWSSRPPNGMAEDAALGLAEGSTGGAPQAPAATQAAAPSQRIPVSPESVLAGIGDPSAGSYEQGQQLLSRIPAELRDRARRVDTVVPLVYGLLIADDDQARQHQHATLTARYGQAFVDAVAREAPALRGLDPELRLPLAELAFSALRRREPQELRQIMHTIGELVRADGRVDVFEYCLSTLLHIELHEVLYHRPPWRERRQRLGEKTTAHAVARLFALFARIGSDDPAAGQAAYDAGMGRVLPGASIPFAVPDEGLVALDAAWPLLDGLHGQDKARLVEGLVLVISHDGVMTVAELELLRTVCGLLHAPLPPIATAARPTGPVPGQA
ncbi:M48 family metallopeptidase [Haloechinothrix halophila]|uniref:M48 family metallopeptidase n=1 Tax=Haloechinothrix halophila TaxID=1069073 RepID=UPI0003F9C599|nr:M48 family metallopeptidase [Haloechinothrix halophila]